MKLIRTYLFLSGFVFAKIASSQTNTFPSSGNVGVGTPTPTVKLQVNGAAAIQGSAGYPTSGAGFEFVPNASPGVDAIQSYNRDTPGWRELRLLGGALSFYTNGSERMRIDGTGNINVSGAIDSDSNQFTFGTQTGSYGAALLYTDSTTDTLKFLINRNPASWLWVHNTSVNAMRLDSAHQLILYNAAGTTAGVTLTPASNRISLGTATLTGSGTALTTNGALTVAGNLTNSNASAVTSFMGNVGVGTATVNNPAGFTRMLQVSAAGSAVFSARDTLHSRQYDFGVMDPAGTGSYDFSIYDATVGLHRFVVKQNGNIGIGTTAPGQKLAVSGTNGIPAGTGSAADGVARFGSSVTNLVLDFGVNGGGGAFSWLQSRDQISYANSYNLALNPNGGNVGIGTTTPSQLLHVNGGNAVLLVTDTNSGGGTFRLGSTDGSKGQWAYDGTANTYFDFPQTMRFRSLTGGTLDRLTVLSNGNVGIGTTTPTQKLTVAGNINKSGSWILGNGAWSADHLEVHVNGWDGVTNGSYGGIVGGHGYYYGGLQSGGNGGGEAASGQLYVAGASMLMGNVGIGTTNPSAKLAVVGEVNVSGNVTTRGGPTSYYGFGEVSYGSLPTNDLDLNRPNLSSGSGIYRINHHTGLSFSAHSVYGGIRFYNQGYSGTNSNPYDSTTGGALAMSIANGYVGIGIASPGAPLEIKKPNGGGRFQFLDEGADVYSAINIRNSANNAFQPLTIRSAGFTVNDGSADRLTVAVGGNVGIGTPSATAKLHVFTSAQTKAVFGRDDGMAAENSLVRINTAGASNYSGIGFDAAATPAAGAAVWMQTNGNGLYLAGNATYANLVATAPHMSITAGGNVGIGTTTPTHKLSVNGTIRAKEIIVDTGWADYVFDESYNLAPLSDVEAHIKAKKHLPGIPSAAEIAEHGVSMGDMQSKLLSKIEELTLHMIAQEKRIEKLEQENRQLKAASQP